MSTPRGSNWAVGHNGKCAPEGSKNNVLKLLMRPYLNLDHRQRGRQARRCPLRTSKIKGFIRPLLKLQNQRKHSLLTFINHGMLMQVMPRTQDMKLILSRGPCVRMLYRSQTGLFQYLGFERARVSFCCKPQWIMCRASPEFERQETRHHIRASLL